MASAASNRTPAGVVYNDRVRDIFGMNSGASYSSTSGTSFLKKLAVNTEENKIQSAANDNRMLREMQTQTKLLRNLQDKVKGFGLSEMLLGRWLTKLMGFAGGGLMAGAGVAGRVAGGASRAVMTAIRSAAVGASSLLKGTVLGIIKPITSGIGRLLSPITNVAKNLGSLFKMPGIARTLGTITKLAPNLTKVFGGLASKIFWPITMLMGAIDGIGGAFNAEELLGRDGVSIVDRIRTGMASAVNGVLFGLPDFLADKLGFKNFASVVDKGAQMFHSAVTRHITDFLGNFMDGTWKFMGQIGTLLKDSFFGSVEWIKKNIDFTPGKIGASIGTAVVRAAGDFGNYIKNGTIGIFTSLQNWVGSSFDNLKKEINNWMPWNWFNGTNKQLPGGSTLRPGAPTNAAARDLLTNGAMTPIRPASANPSNESSPSSFVGSRAPYDTLRLAATATSGAMPFGAVDGSMLSNSDIANIGIVAGVTSQVTAIPQVKQQAIETAESLDDTLKGIREDQEDAFSKMTDDVAQDWVGLLKTMMGDLGTAAKPVIDAAARQIPDSVKAMIEAGLPAADAAKLESVFGGSPSTSGSAAVPAPMAPAAGGSQPSQQSLPNLGGATPMPGGAGTSALVDNQGRVISTASTNMSPPERAFLDTLAMGDVGSGGNYWESPSYNTIVGGGTFDSYADHPRVFGTPTSTAAGRYQFTKTTWDDVVKQYNAQNPTNPITDFSPQNQDRAAMFLAERDYKTRTGGRSLQADLQNPPANFGELIRSGLGGHGINTTWEILQRKSAGEIGDAFTSNLERNKQYATPTNAPVSPTPLNQDTLPPNMLDLPIKTTGGSTKTLAELGVTTWSDLQTKGGQAFNGGENDPNTLFAINAVSEAMGSNFNRVTAQNDNYHQRYAPNSGHTDGHKVDFTVKNGDYAGAHKQTAQILQEQFGLVEGKDFSIISRNHGTAPHIDFSLKPSGQAIVDQYRQAQIEQSQQQVKPLTSTTRPQSYVGQDTFQPAGNTPRPGTVNATTTDNLGSYSDLFNTRDVDKNGWSWLNKDNASATTPAELLREMIDNPELKARGLSVPQGDLLSNSVTKGILDATIQQPKQPSFVPFEPVNPFVPPPPTPAGSNVAKNPTGEPSKAVSDTPDLGSMPSIDELSMLLINSDMMGA